MLCLALPTALIRDAGHTVVAPGTITCLGIGPAQVSAIDAVTVPTAALLISLITSPIVSTFDRSTVRDVVPSLTSTDPSRTPS